MDDQVKPSSVISAQYCLAQFKILSLFEFPAKAFLKLQGDPWLILASPSKVWPHDQPGGAIWGGPAKISHGFLNMEREVFNLFLKF